MTDSPATDEALISDIAHLITGVCGSTCCHKTGGQGGELAHPHCDCRSTAAEILARIQYESLKNHMQWQADRIKELEAQVDEFYPEPKGN